MRGDCNSQDLFLLHSLTQLYTGGDQETTAALYKMSPDQHCQIGRRRDRISQIYTELICSVYHIRVLILSMGKSDCPDPNTPRRVYTSHTLHRSPSHTYVWGVTVSV
jgi:hypothetical protein